jgi:hypothetical protein
MGVWHGNWVGWERVCHRTVRPSAAGLMNSCHGASSRTNVGITEASASGDNC